jgi:hypothetical protein
MRKFAVCLLIVAPLCAADFWQAKPYTEWSEKNVKKMLDDSPWARPVNIAGDLVPPRTGGGKRGLGARGSMTEIGNPNEVTPDPMGDAPRSGVGRSAQNADPDRGTAPMLTFTVRWESALPVKQARVRARYGSEAGTSQEARRILETEEKNYLITVSGLPANTLRGDAQEIKTQAIADAALTVKGQDPIKPIDFMLRRVNGDTIAVFAFPRTIPLTLDDKEVEFRAKFASIPVKLRFALKNMIFAGKLEL